MAIQYAGGTNVNATFTGDTKANIITAIQTQLTAAGWSVVSGGGTTNLVMQSAATPAALAIRCNFKDNSGTCVQVSLQSGDGVKTGTNSTSAGGNLLPAAAKTFRIIANKYQFFVFVPGVFGSASRNFVAAGVPYIPSPVATPTYAGWLVADSLTDSSATTANSWRNKVTFQQNTFGNQQLLFGVILWENSNNQQNNTNCPSLLNLVTVCHAVISDSGGGTMQSGNPPLYRWQSGDIISADPLLAWGDSAIGDEPKIKAQLWDAIIIHDSITGDSTTSFDSHNWYNLTDANIGSIGSSIRGSVFVVIP